MGDSGSGKLQSEAFILPVLANRNIRVANPPGGLAKTCLLAFYYAIYYAILFFTTLFTTLREAPANDLYVFWHIPNRQYGCGVFKLQYRVGAAAAAQSSATAKACVSLFYVNDTCSIGSRQY